MNNGNAVSNLAGHSFWFAVPTLLLMFQPVQMNNTLIISF